MPLSALAAFWAVSMLFVLTPGADWAYAISAGSRSRMVLPAVSGMLVGHLVATILVAFGVAGLMAGIPHALSALTIVGALYLAWIGVDQLRSGSEPTGQGNTQELSPREWAVRGFYISALNPKVILLFLALLPQFAVMNASWPVPVQMIVLGAVHVLSCGLVYFAVGFGASRLLANQPGRAKRVSNISGAIMIALAFLLVARQFFGT